MPTDWTLVRKLMNAAIDACEHAERLGVNETHRALPTGVDDVTVRDVLTSAWTYPENVKYDVIRARQRLGDSRPYKPELARALEHAASVCGELVGSDLVGEDRNSASQVEALARWYEEVMTPQLESALGTRR